ncbi:MAG TPA: sulfatase-like hydrolase/transferase, partial [Acidimicrobiales bacterium]|nr:sulfatase-like hydrolase/transferase [Acidimicrobiales bacterium]
ALGCNGNTVARTPVIDALAASGCNFRRAYTQNTVCMPARSTILTGQYPRTHGVVANGIPLPEDAPSIASHLSERAGYRTALFGKAHFEPGFDLRGRYEETARALRGDTGPWRGFDTSVQAMHVAAAILKGPEAQENVYPILHYGNFIADQHPEHLQSFAALLGGIGGGDTGAPETKNNPIPREWYHTDWIADLAIQWLGELSDDEDWFCWVSFPDPHHPWDPPAGELGRVDWRDMDLPPGRPSSEEEIKSVLAGKPRHWLGWYEGTFENREGFGRFDPASLTEDQLREITAKTHVMNELIDEACGRVLAKVTERGWDADTDILFTTDHGELLGDFGLLFKGPFHVDALMRLPLVWRPAPSAGVTPAVIDEPVGTLDIAPTLCAIAGVEQPEWMQGGALPTGPGSGRERVLCEWDSQFPGYGMHLRTIYRDGFILTRYEESTDGRPNGLERVMGDAVLKSCGIHYDGSEGELYDVEADPHQWVNLWDDPSHRSLRDDLVADLYDNLPDARPDPLLVAAPV